jgi:hypothetical protein
MQRIQDKINVVIFMGGHERRADYRPSLANGRIDGRESKKSMLQKVPGKISGSYFRTDRYGD